MKIVRMGLIFLLVTFAISMQGSSEDERLSYILNRLKSEGKKIETGSFDFKQKILVKSTSEEKLVRGSIRFKAPDKLYAEYVEPYPQIIVCNGEKVWFYLPDYNQVSIESSEKLQELMGINLDFFLWIMEIEDLENCEKEILEETDGECKIRLVHESRNEGEIILTISKEYWVPVEIESNDSYTVVSTHITNIVKNDRVKDEFFEFEIPQEAQVFESP